MSSLSCRSGPRVAERLEQRREEGQLSERLRIPPDLAFLEGHFPGHPVMPGVLIIEAMAQAGGLLLMDSVSDREDKVVYFMSLDNVKWRKPVIPGDQLVFEVEMVQFRRSVCKLRGVAKVDGKVVAEADMMAGIVAR